MKRSAFFTFVIIRFLAACAPPVVTPEATPTKTVTPTSVPADSWQSVWADEFEKENGSAPDPQKWNHQAGSTFSDGFHVFTLEWEPNEIRWYVDDIPFHSETKWFTSAKKDAVCPVSYDQDFYLLLNVAVGGHWPGRPHDTSVFPQSM